MAETDDAGGATQRIGRALRPKALIAKAKHISGTLRNEYEAGKRGDDSEPQQLWLSPKEQLAAMMALLSAARRESPAEPAPAGGSEQPVVGEAEADDVVEALGKIDWGKVRASTAERTGDAAKAMKTMAGQVDWAKVQPVAGQVSSALIAAVASGQLPVGGRMGPVVARAIVNQGGLGQQVAKRIEQQHEPMPPDFRGAIEATARDA